jgi:hypothetical protein
VAISATTLAPTHLLAQSSETTTPRLGCLSGYPDGTFRGDRPVLRYEFAAGLNACLEQINQLLPNRSELATRSDLEALIQRQRELNQEVRQLNDRTEQLAK